MCPMHVDAYFGSDTIVTVANDDITDNDINPAKDDIANSNNDNNITYDDEIYDE